MGVAVLQPRDCLTRNNILTPPQRNKKPSSNRRRRSPPRHQPATSPPSPGSKKKNLNHINNNNNNVRILKRGEETGKKIPDLTVEKPDLRSNRQIGSDPIMILTQNRVSNRKSTPSALFYAGPVTSTSPPPSEVPVPAFFAKKTVSSVFKPSDATNDLIRILRLDIA